MRMKYRIFPFSLTLCVLCVSWLFWKDDSDNSTQRDCGFLSQNVHIYLSVLFWCKQKFSIAELFSICREKCPCHSSSPLSECWGASWGSYGGLDLRAANWGELRAATTCWPCSGPTPSPRSRSANTRRRWPSWPTPTPPTWPPRGSTRWCSRSTTPRGRDQSTRQPRWSASTFLMKPKSSGGLGEPNPQIHSSVLSQWWMLVVSFSGKFKF